MPESANNSPHTVALVATELAPGGAERCLTMLAESIDRARFRPLVYSLMPRPTAEKLELVARLEAADVPICFLNARSKFALPRVVFSLAREFRRERPAVVQCFLHHANLVGLAAARLAGNIPVAFGMRVAEPSRLRMRMETTTSRWANKIVCVSDDVRKHCRSFGMNERKLAVIPNAVDIERFKNAEPTSHESLQLTPPHRMIVVIGRLHKQKGIDWLLEMLPELLKRFPDHDVRFIGTGPLEEAIHEFNARHGTHGIVAMLGQRSDIPAILKRAELLLLPSRYEGMPNVVLEAMAAGVPIAATRSDGVLELLGSDAERTTCDFGDSKRFMEIADQLLNSAPFRREIIERLQRRAETLFSIPVAVRAYESLWSDILAGT